MEPRLLGCIRIVKYRQTSNIIRTLVGNKTVDQSNKESANFVAFIRSWFYIFT